VTRPEAATPYSGHSFGIPADDELAGRLFPPLPGQVHWGLGRTRRILRALGEPHRAYPVLHVGGTNGKGSVARIWAGILEAAGYRSGLYTSPHLVSFRERILVDGSPLSDELLESWAGELRPHLANEQPSFFEAATALALLGFQRSGVDVAVVEVGLGGRLDATNVVLPVLTAITNVGLDHLELLGGDLKAVAREKAGILKPGVPAFTAADIPEVLDVLEATADSVGTTLYRVHPSPRETGIDGTRLKVRTRTWGEIEVDSPLIGVHQADNLALAVESLDALPSSLEVSVHEVQEGVRRSRVPGRFQIESRDQVTWIFDVAHNLPGVEALASTLEMLDVCSPVIGVVGILADKGWAPMLERLATSLDVLILTVPDGAPESRRWDVDRAAEQLAEGKVEVIPDMGEALDLAKRRSHGSGTVVVTGSVHTVGEGLKRLGWIPNEALPPTFETG